MIKRLTLITLLGISMVAMVGSEATAGCIPLSNGGQYCASWITGSEICNGAAKGIKKICTDPNDPSTCSGEVLCQAGGTFPTSSSPSLNNCNESTTSFPPATDFCGISGIAFCVNPASNAARAQGQPFTFDTVITGTSDTFKCAKNGKCTFTNVELIPSTDDLSQVQCINSNWTAVDFTADKFKAKSCYCPGTYDVTSPGQPTCVPTETTGQETCLIELCTVDLTGIKINDTRAYACGQN